MALAAVALANARKNTKEVAANKILFHAAAAAAAATAAATAAEPLTAGLTAAPEATEHTTTPTVRQPWLPLSCSRHSCLQACCGGCALGSVIGWFGEGVRDGLLLVVRACAVVLVAPRARCLPCFRQRLGRLAGRVGVADSVMGCILTAVCVCVCAVMVDAGAAAAWIEQAATATATAVVDAVDQNVVLCTVGVGCDGSCRRSLSWALMLVLDVASSLAHINICNVKVERRKKARWLS